MFKLNNDIIIQINYYFDFLIYGLYRKFLKIKIFMNFFIKCSLKKTLSIIKLLIKYH
jgi:hypothetical protein